MRGALAFVAAFIALLACMVAGHPHPHPAPVKPACGYSCTVERLQGEREAKARDALATELNR